MMKMLSNADVEKIRNELPFVEDFLNYKFIDKIDIVFSMAKELNNTINSLNIFDGMLKCSIDKSSDKDTVSELEGLRIYISEVIKEIEELNSD